MRFEGMLKRLSLSSEAEISAKLKGKLSGAVKP
jgi:hypothetical protein